MQQVWQYGRQNGLERAVRTGATDVDMRGHFHDEAQITIVLRGERRFQTPFGTVVARAGETAVIPVGVAHRALDLATDSYSINLYLPVDAGFDGASDMTRALLDEPGPVADVARSFALSREGFIRRFSRTVGMTPHAYRLAVRLNDARRRLAAGHCPSDAAAAAGFADQSHLTRLFRASFGVTPGVYRAAMQV